MLTDRVRQKESPRRQIGLWLVLIIMSCVRAWSMPLPGVALAWDPSTDPSVTGYNVYYGTASRTYTNMIPAGSATSVIVSNLVTGVTYYFAATTYTSDGVESDYSAEAAYALFLPNTPPTLDALTNLTISQDSGTRVVP